MTYTKIEFLGHVYSAYYIFWEYVDFSNMSVYQLVFFRRSTAASLASPHNSKDMASHPSLLFYLTCEPIKCVASCKITPITKEIRNLHLDFGTGTVGSLGAHSEKDMIFGSVPKYAKTLFSCRKTVFRLGHTMWLPPSLPQFSALLFQNSLQWLMKLSDL